MILEKIVKKSILYRGEYLVLERFDVRLPDGRNGHREVVRVPDAVAVIPVDEDGQVHIVKQFRAPIETQIIEVPAGLLNEGESVEEAAARECEEETGYRPHKLHKLISYAHAEGYSTGWITLFLGTELEHTGRFHLDSTEFLECMHMPFGTLLDMVLEHRIVDSKTILSTLLTKERFGPSGTD